MKPDWKDAPEWAKWLAMDRGGQWYWYESEPEQSAYSWDQGPGRFAVALPPQKFWISTKVMRPTPAEAGSEGQGAVDGE